MNDAMLNRLQLIELNILIVFDKFCRDNSISYSLFAGTALGAVRHKGFIPWDDDVDIFMDLKNYDKFISLWRSNPVDGYYLQATDDLSVSINHTKIRKNGTILASLKELESPDHHGIWIDIFPFYKVPTKRYKRILFNYNAYIRILFTRNHIPEKANVLVKISGSISQILPKSIKRFIRVNSEKHLRKYDDLTSGFEYEDISATIWMNTYYPSNIFEKYTDICFSDNEFQIVSDYRRLLEIKYGDYMQLPPLEERVCRHNPEVVYFGDD